MDKDIIFQPLPTNRKIKNLINEKFFKLTVIGYAGSKNGTTLWFCRCECGNVKKISRNNLRNKSIKSCGCYRREFAQTNPTTHGEASHRGNRSAEYNAYVQAKMRCNNPNRPQYKWYGGRGIQFRFENFLEFLAEVGRKPTPEHSLDRINVDGHYEKGNVRWATQTEQTNNQTKSRFITLNGEEKTLSEWCRIYQVKVVTVHTRLSRGSCAPCAFTVSRCPHRS